MPQYGVDISEYQAPSVIDTEAPEFVVCKLTESDDYRVTQSWLDEAVGRARTRGLPLGFYHFAHADKTVAANLGNFMAMVERIPGGIQPGDMVALDYEIGPVTPGWADAWLTECRKQTGRVPMFYSYPDFIGQLGGPPSGWPLWLAHYADVPALPCALWQYTTMGDTLDWNKFDGPDVGNFFASLKVEGTKMPYGVIVNNNTDFQIARDTLHLQTSLVIYDEADARKKKVANKLYIGASQVPVKPYDRPDEKDARNWAGFTGRGVGRTKAWAAWMVKAIQAVGSPPQD